MAGNVFYSREATIIGNWWFRREKEAIVFLHLHSRVASKSNTYICYVNM